MLKALQFVRGAVAKKDFNPVLTHFKISKGTVRGYNGEMALCSPIPLDLEVNPNAVPFLKALNACSETIAIHQTPTGRLSIKSGEFKVFVDCSTEDLPDVLPQGQEIKLTGNLLPALRVLAPLTALDASRPWAQGVLLRECSAFATNNVVLAEYWLGFQVPVAVNIPKPAVTELLRIGEEPERLLLSENSCSFYFSGGRWLYTLTYSSTWPNLHSILDKDSTPKKVPETFWNTLHHLAPFCDKEEGVWLTNELARTHADENIGAQLVIPGLELSKELCFNIKHLLLLEGKAIEMDLNNYPLPCYFFGENIRGAILGRQG